MADTTITGLPNATTPLSGTERVPMDQSGETRDASTQDIANLAGAAITAAVAAHVAAADPHTQYVENGDSPTFVDATVTGLLTATHIHGNIAGSLYLHAKNTSGGQLLKGTPVRVVGAVGDTTTLEVAAADAASAETMPAVAILDDTLANNGQGNAVLSGEIVGLNTSAFAVGQTLYVGVGGGLTGTKPASNAQAVAVVGRVSATTGTIAVTINAVMPAVPSAADATPQPLGTAAIGTSADYAREDHVHAMPSAAAVGADPAGTAASAVSAHVAAADPHPAYALESSLATVATSGAYTDLTGRPSLVTALDGLSDVTIASPADQQVLKYDAATGQWINAAAPGGGGGTVTSVGLSVPTGFSVAGSPVTTSGTLALGYAAGYQGYTGTEATKLAGIAAGAEVNVNADWNATSGDAQILNKPPLGTAAALNVGTTAGTVAAGDDGRFHDAVTLAASVADVLGLTGQQITADDPGADRLIFWDDSAGKLTHLTLGANLSITDTTLNAAAGSVQDVYVIACSDETTALTTGTAKVTFRMPTAGTLTAVKATVTTAPVGNPLIVDINESGTTLLSTKLSIDASEKTSTTAATPAVISDSALADDAEITIDIDQVGSTTAGAGLKVYLYVTRG